MAVLVMVASAWKTLIVQSSNNPVTGGQAIFPLKITHTGVGTEYLLSANASSDFSSMTLPAGVNRCAFLYVKQWNRLSVGWVMKLAKPVI